MIHHLSGTLVEKKPTHAIVECGGVGYFVGTPASTYEALPEAGAACRLLTVFVVRDDGQFLYGFATEGERETFVAATGVSGIGPKMALAMLSSMRPAELQAKIVEGDAAFLTSIPGIGKKTAERLVVELRDKMARLDVTVAGAAATGGAGQQARADALAALEALGFARAVAERKLRLVLRAQPGLQSADELVRLALREPG